MPDVTATVAATASIGDFQQMSTVIFVEARPGCGSHLRRAGEEKWPHPLHKGR
jgi:hypothetical protein